MGRHASPFDRDPSFEYRYRKMREFSSKPFKFDLKSPEAGNHYDDYDSSASTAQACTLSKKTRDFIGENLLDIENTLKALNLDFLQTFNELEKNDSAETLFGENYTYETNINPKILSTALKLTKFPQNYGSVDASPKSVKSSQFSPLEKQMGPQTLNGMQYLNDSSSADKLLDGKRSSTPDTGFASRETTTSSRRGSQKSSYSPQESHYSPNYTSQVEDARAAYAHLKANGSFPSRQRSMSFTENYEVKSPILTEPQSAKRNGSGNIGATIVSNNGIDGHAILRNRPRNSIVYKPKTIKARNMRRLSYNPIVFDSSSSSNSEPETNQRNIAQSECDIRSKLFTSSRHHRTQNAQYLNRKSSQYQCNTSNAFVTNPDKLYGSNASIKSAPQYNNFASDRQLHHYLDQKFNLHSHAAPIDDQPLIHPNNISNFDRNARSCSRRRQISRINYVLPPPPPPPLTANRTFDAPPTINFLNYNRFDVSKLTGKSPTTQSFLQELFPDSKATPVTPTQSIRSANQQTSPLNNNISVNASAFHWPEKIHVSAVAQSTSLWPPKQTKSSATTKTKSSLDRAASLQQITSDSSSSTETDLQPNDLTPRIPPSPAP